MELGRAGRDRGDGTEEELEHVEVVDGVLDERAGARLGGIAAPRRAVVPANRDELVVAEDHAHRAAAVGIGDEVAQDIERGRAPQDQPDLVGDARGRHDLGHGTGIGDGRRQRLLAEDVEPPLRGGVHQTRVLGGPGADVDRVASVEHLILGATGRLPARRGEGRGALGVGVVHAGPLERHARGPEVLRVERGNETRTEEADSHDRILSQLRHPGLASAQRVLSGVPGSRTKLRPMTPKKMAIAVVAVLVGGVALVSGGTWAYITFVKGPAPARLTVESAAEAARTTTTVAGAASATPTSDDPAGTWTVSEGSLVGYRVQEVLNRQSTEAYGRTSGVTGSLVIAGTSVASGSFTADMTTVASNESRRDGQFRGRIMNTEQFPTATFALTKPIELTAIPAVGAKASATATGDLTLRGVTRTVTFPVEAGRSDSALQVAGTIPVVFAEWSIPNPSNTFAQTEDHGVLEFALILTRS